ncbi:NAD(P)-dependent alcohol dehydrogenase [Algoriphagus confluentis]|uniref:NAD(P)-dependent alcohol dehydrogenase n=1 Tax=Algoriphagus confluentis TaxID=1697556 RepID=A0ABQ6PSJ6_9BACT|nr:NAD(P)-dependent alcohol dehydrogenase [Algoriphagus confluentis]
MKVVYCTQYGSPEVLQLREIPKPSPKANQILVKLVATTVNSGDVRIRKFDVQGWMKLVMRLVLGVSKPRKPILGTVYSGVVEAVGNKVSKFKAGDKVFGMTGFNFGTNAEYIAVNQNSIVLELPINASFEEAAAIVFGGHTAIYFLEKARIREASGKKVMIIGATGAVGTAAIQLANYYKADITTVCSSMGKQLVEDLGVKKTIYYDKEDFSKRADKYDIIFDAFGATTKKQCENLLQKNGIYKNVNSFASESIHQLQLLKELFEKGAIKAVIDRSFQLDQIKEAHAYVESGRKKGNVILKISM